MQVSKRDSDVLNARARLRERLGYMTLKRICVGRSSPTGEGIAATSGGSEEAVPVAEELAGAGTEAGTESDSSSTYRSQETDDEGEVEECADSATNESL